MKELKYTLIADGRSDSILMNIINWLLNNLFPQLPVKGMFADFAFLEEPPKKLNEKIKYARHYYPYDILFVHRDAESTSKHVIINRIEEIQREIQEEEEILKTICIIPVKMMEAWLLINADAIKKAAGNRNYSEKIKLPPINQIEKLPDPKDDLHKLLRAVSGRKGRYLKKFNVHQAVHLVAENIDDFSVLRNVTAFQFFEADLQIVLERFIMENQTTLK